MTQMKHFSQQQKLYAGLIGLAILALVVAVYVWKANPLQYFSNRSTFVAVFVTNNQVYFGQISQESEHELVLTHVYYLKASADTNAAATPEATLSLVKLGEELHSPQDWMKINKDHVYFVEKMKDSGVIMDAIKKYEAERK